MQVQRDATHGSTGGQLIAGSELQRMSESGEVIPEQQAAEDRDRCAKPNRIATRVAPAPDVDSAQNQHGQREMRPASRSQADQRAGQKSKAAIRLVSQH